MDMAVITQFISSLGFPIAACVYMAWQTNKMTERHQEEISSLRAVVEANTLSVQRLVDKLDSLGGETDEGN